MTNLNDVTFIIPIRIDSHDRARNIKTLLMYLLNNFSCKVIVKESDVTSKMGMILSRCDVSWKNLTYLFESSEDPTFYRTRLLNEMITIAETPVVVNCDSDVLLEPHVYAAATKMIMNGEYDFVYPYGEGLFQRRVLATDNMIDEFINSCYDFSTLKDYIMWDAKYGHIQFCSRVSYIKSGLENENFIAYGPEDVERYWRWDKLGFKIGRLNETVYHLEHHRTPNSNYDNPYSSHNSELWRALSSLSKEQLINYYDSQPYMKKYSYHESK